MCGPCAHGRTKTLPPLLCRRALCADAQVPGLQTLCNVLCLRLHPLHMTHAPTAMSVTAVCFCFSPDTSCSSTAQHDSCNCL
jgi:hypothetical protein